MPSGNSWGAEGNASQPKPWVITTVAAMLVVVLGLRLFYIQVYRYAHFVNRAESIRIKKEIIEAPRGRILDRNGVVMAENRISYSITFDPLERRSIDASVPRLLMLAPEVPGLMGVARADVADVVRLKTKNTQNPEKILRNVDFGLLSVIEENNLDLPGVGAVFDQRRYYPFGAATAHVIGYMGELNRDEYDRLKSRGYAYGSSIGQNGIEKRFEDMLKGDNGYRFMEMNYMSRILGSTTEAEPVPPTAGRDLALTLDTRLQLAAYEAFGDTLLGSLVALDPRTGEVLALVSAPSYDPNEVTRIYSTLVTDPDKPLFNRALQASYPPGSPLKPLTAIVGLENGIPATTRFQPCTGAYYFGRWYKCWNENGHGSLDMVGAIMHSCNVYFYQLNRRMDIDVWHSYAEKLGLGVRTGIDLPGETAGFVPDRQFYVEANGGYSQGVMLNLAIGQGEILASVLQLAHYAGILGTSGHVATPHVVMDAPPVSREVEGVAVSSFDVVRRGMRGVVNEVGGTARSAALRGHVIAGKTGTAQNPHGPAHKVFIGFAPYDDPTIAVACVVENADIYPSSPAIPIARRVFETYFQYYPDPSAPIVAAEAR